jgi:predicted ATPase
MHVEQEDQMIRDLRFANFKSFEFPEPLEIPRFVVLVGNNSAGKTNFCDAFTFTRDLLESGLRRALLDDERRKGFESIVRGREPSREITFYFTFEEPDGLDMRYRFSVGASARTGEPQILSEKLVGRLESRRGGDTTYLERDAATSRVYNELSRPDRHETWEIQANYLQVSQLKDEKRFPALAYVREALSSVLVLRPDTSVLRRREVVGGEPSLGSKGQGLVAVLDAAEPKRLQRLAHLLAEGDPAIESLRLLGAGEGQKEISLLEKGEDRPYGPHQISDGTLRLLAMLTAITGTAPEIETLIIEEPENGIHFSRLRRLIELCRQRIREDPKARIILTTHSVPLLHELERDEAMSIVRGKDGVSRVLPPPEEARWRRFREEVGYTIGDLYTTGLWPKPEPKFQPHSPQG